MKIIVPANEIRELLIEDVLKSHDKGIVVTPEVGKRGEGLEELQKSIIGIDATIVGPKEAARIHGVPESSASKYANGKDVDDDTAARINNVKHEIKDLATTKLMQSLNLFDPTDFEKPGDLVRAAGQLSAIVERLEGKNPKGNGEVHLHLHAPHQKKVEQYDVIDV